MIAIRLSCGGLFNSLLRRSFAYFNFICFLLLVWLTMALFTIKSTLNLEGIEFVDTITAKGIDLHSALPALINGRLDQAFLSVINVHFSIGGYEGVANCFGYSPLWCRSKLNIIQLPITSFNFCGTFNLRRVIFS